MIKQEVILLQDKNLNHLYNTINSRQPHGYASPFTLTTHYTLTPPSLLTCYHPNNLTKHGWQYGLSFCSLKVPLFSCFRQKAQTKCSGWNFLYMAVIHRPDMGFWQPAHSEPLLAWKWVSQYGKPSWSKKLLDPKGLRHSWS